MFREETGPGGERVGQYSYIDQAGKTITVKYSAGKDGFKKGLKETIDWFSIAENRTLYKNEIYNK